MVIGSSVLRVIDDFRSRVSSLVFSYVDRYRPGVYRDIESSIRLIEGLFGEREGAGWWEEMGQGYSRWLERALDPYFPSGYFDDPDHKRILENFFGESFRKLMTDIPSRFEHAINRDLAEVTYGLYRGKKEKPGEEPIDEILSRSKADKKEILKNFIDRGNDWLADPTASYHMKAEKKPVVQDWAIRWDPTAQKDNLLGQISKMVSEFLQNPTTVKNALLETRGGGMIPESTFIPRMDEQRVSELKSEDPDYPATVGGMDKDLMIDLSKKDKVKWRYEDLRVKGRKGGKPVYELEFSLPNITGDRTYKIDLPQGMKKMESGGDYTFDILDVGPSGVRVRFEEQAQEGGEGELDLIKEKGLGDDQLRKLMRNLVGQYSDSFRNLSLSDFIDQMRIEGLSAPLMVHGKRITSEESLHDALGTTDKKQVYKVPVHEIAKEEQEKQQAVEEYWESADIVDILRKAGKTGESLIGSVASRFPRIDSSIKTLPKALSTQEFIKHILELILNPRIPIGSGAGRPWIDYVITELRTGALFKDPRFKKFFQVVYPIAESELTQIHKLTPEKVQKAPAVSVPDKTPVQQGPGAVSKQAPSAETSKEAVSSDLTPDQMQTITEYFQQIGDQVFRNQFNRIAQAIKQVIITGARQGDVLLRKVLNIASAPYTRVVEEEQELERLMMGEQYDKAEALLKGLPKDVQDLFERVKDLIAAGDEYVPQALEGLLEKYRSHRLPQYIKEFESSQVKKMATLLEAGLMSGNLVSDCLG